MFAFCKFGSRFDPLLQLHNALCPWFFLHCFRCIYHLRICKDWSCHTVESSCKSKSTKYRSGKLMKYFREVTCVKGVFRILICYVYYGTCPHIYRQQNCKHQLTLFPTAASLARWFTVLFILNSSSNSLLLFWRNKKLRIHAEKSMKMSLEQAVMLTFLDGYIRKIILLKSVF